MERTETGDGVIDGRVAAMLNHGSQNDRWPALAGIKIKDGVAYAADGFRALRFPLRRDPSVAASTDGLWPINALRLLRRVCGKKSAIVTDNDGSRASVLSRDGISLSVKLMDYTYPSIDEEILNKPLGGEVFARAVISTRYLREISEAFERAGSRWAGSSAVEIRFVRWDELDTWSTPDTPEPISRVSGVNAGVLFVGRADDDAKLVGIVMPMVVGEHGGGWPDGS